MIPHPYPSTLGEGTLRMQLLMRYGSPLSTSRQFSAFPPLGGDRGAGAPLNQLMCLLNNAHHKYTLHLAHVLYLA